MDIRLVLSTAIKNPLELHCCLDMEAALDTIDFKEVEQEAVKMLALEKDNNGKLILGEGYVAKDGVATIKIRGLLVPDLGIDLSAYGITGYDVIAEYVEHANETAKAEKLTKIELDINSTGGFVSGISGLVEVLEASKLPIYTKVTGSMASAAYHIGVTAKEVNAAKGSGIIGSIGVRASHTNYAKMYEKAGIEKRDFASGFWKTAFASHKPLSKKEEKRIQQSVDDSALIFFEHVAKYREKLSIDEVKKLDGDTFTSKKAFTLGLIDRIGDLKSEETKAMADPIDETKDETPKGEASFTQADLEAATAKAVADALANAENEKTAAVERAKAISTHANAPDAIKTLLGSEAFASVKTEDLTALMDALPQGFKAIMDTEGGAGLEASPTDLVDKTTEEQKAKAKEDAVEKVASIPSVL